MKYLKLFESYGSGPETELIDQLDDSIVEEYFDEHLKNEDFNDIISLWPSAIWNHIDDERAMEDIIYDEKSYRELDDFEYEIKDYLNGKHIKPEEEKQIYKIRIKSEVDLDELKTLKKLLKETEDIEEKKEFRKEIRKLNKEIKRIKELDLYELLDEMSDDDLKSVIENVFDKDEFIESVVEDRYKDMSLQEYVEEIYGNVDNIEFSSNPNKRGDWDWILKYVDEAAVIKDYNDNELYDYKEERVQEEIYRSIELQKKLLKLKKKNALLLYDLFVNNSDDDQIKDTYKFQKRYIEAYAKDNNDNSMAKAEGLKNLYDEFGLNNAIEEEYSEYMHYVYADKFNL